MKKKVSCYECVYRGESEMGTAHSSCQHPLVKKTSSDSILFSALGVLYCGIVSPKGMNVSGAPHGIRSGWFMWPTDFDPVWLENCDGFKLAENKVKA